MYLRLTPIKLNLYALVTLEVDLGFTTIVKTLFKTKLFSYATPTIMKKLIDNTKEDPDTSPPQIKSFTDDGSGVGTTYPTEAGAVLILGP